MIHKFIIWFFHILFCWAPLRSLMTAHLLFLALIPEGLRAVVESELSWAIEVPMPSVFTVSKNQCYGSPTNIVAFHLLLASDISLSLCAQLGALLTTLRFPFWRCSAITLGSNEAWCRFWFTVELSQLSWIQGIMSRENENQNHSPSLNHRHSSSAVLHFQDPFLNHIEAPQLTELTENNNSTLHSTNWHKLHTHVTQHNSQISSVS